MFRKIMIIAVPATAFLMTLFVSADSASQAFAKGGGRGGHGTVRGHRGFDRNFRRFDRYRWGYPSYGYVGYETPVCATCEPVVETPVAPVCTTCEPVVETPVAPVCTTCESSYVAVGSVPYWGYGHYRNYGRFHGERGHRGGGRRR
jgi:hypothetical protein